MSDLLQAAFVGRRRLPDPAASSLAHRLARATQGLLALYAAVLLASVGLNAWRPLVYETASMAAVGAVFVVTAIAFAWWTVAMYRLVPDLGGTFPDHATWWAAAGYVIPIMNLFRPYQIMSEIRDATDPAAVGVGFGAEAPRMPLGVWWGLWITAGVVERILNRVPLESEFAASTTFTVLAVATIGLWLAATGAAVVVVRQIDAGQRAVEAVLAKAA